MTSNSEEIKPVAVHLYPQDDMTLNSEEIKPVASI